jgi:dephospho-CoA kinase
MLEKIRLTGRDPSIKSSAENPKVGLHTVGFSALDLGGVVGYDARTRAILAELRQPWLRRKMDQHFMEQAASRLLAESRGMACW